MYENIDQLIEILKECTVRLKTTNESGTGFFIAPGTILTCAHVVKEAETLNVFWKDILYKGKVQSHLKSPLLDLATIGFVDSSPQNHPCVYTDKETTLSDDLYSYGYTDEYPNGDSVTFQFEGSYRDEFYQNLLKLKAGHVRPGLSGAPLLNLKTKAVCGIIKRTRDRSSDLGARAIPIETFFSQWSDILTKQKDFHRNDSRWTSLLTRENQLQDELNSSNNFNSSIIRKMVSESLTDRELNDLCFDEFPRVYDQFSEGMAKAAKIQILIEFCSRQRDFPKLINFIKVANPNNFARYRNSLKNLD